MSDEIIKELWQIKDAIAQEYGNDINALVEHLRSMKHEQNRRVINLRSIKEKQNNSLNRTKTAG
ncbi:MAG: hypothetical protein ACMUIP_09540 [bacterium]